MSQARVLRVANHPRREEIVSRQNDPLLAQREHGDGLARPNLQASRERQSEGWQLVFEKDGVQHRITPVIDSSTNDYFLIFADPTNRSETYKAGRYLHAPFVNADGETYLDFNKAYNPPCAFTAYATCPLPPEENRLEVPVEAGEKNWAGDLY